jgi:Mn-dependent DtxR family transcriptional regulator
MDTTDGFYTLKGYELHADLELTTAMEDYLEMICRLSEQAGRARVVDLARLLHVRPSSVTKMVGQLDRSGYIRARRYGGISLTERGRAAGAYLLHRHEVLHRFLCVLNQSTDELEQVEKIEHFINRTTVENLERLTERLLGEKKST